MIDENPESEQDDDDVDRQVDLSYDGATVIHINKLNLEETNWLEDVIDD